MHLLSDNKFIPYEPVIQIPSASIGVLIREFNPETWELGPLFEVQIPKTLKANDFGKYVHQKFFSHILSEHFWGTKVALIKHFIRSNLILKKWDNMVA